MKYFALLAVLSIIFAMAVAQDPIKLTEEQKAVVVKNAALCMQQEKTTKEDVQKLRQGQFDNADQNLKCFTNCFLEKSGFLSNGNVQESVVSSKLGPIVGESRVADIMQQCNSIKGADNCDTAFRLYECYYKQNAGTL